FFFQAEDGIRDPLVTGVQTCALPICHQSWRNEAVYRLLETHRVALCVAETDEEAQPAEVVGPASYLRLHRSRYADEDLRRWAGWIGDRTAEGRDVFAYFTHEDGAPATEYARQLIQLTASAPRS